MAEQTLGFDRGNDFIALITYLETILNQAEGRPAYKHAAGQGC